MIVVWDEGRGVVWVGYMGKVIVDVVLVKGFGGLCWVCWVGWKLWKWIGLVM